MQHQTDTTDRSQKWPRRMAILLAVCTFPLIGVGSLVTTYDAGMAVYDWPNTYGYNLFLYPWQMWITGPFDLFVEHGHRLFGALVGMLTIGYVSLLYRYKQSTVIKAVGWLTLCAVILQGVLGGLRVLLDERTLAMIHGCTGPLFFALCVLNVLLLSKWWKRISLAQYSTENQPSYQLGNIPQLAILTAILAFVQLALGAWLRHLPVMASPGEFRLALIFHIAFAVVLALHVFYLSFQILFHQLPDKRLFNRLAIFLSLLTFIQISLGIGTYVSKYAWPSWMHHFQFAASFLVQDSSFAQALITTVHVMTGSLILITAFSLAATLVKMKWSKISLPFFKSRWKGVFT